MLDKVSSNINIFITKLGLQWVATSELLFKD
jgi:hypothetical protein